MTAAPPDIEHEAIAIETGPGQRLHDARRAASMSVADVAAQLHLDSTTIEALESDDYAKLPAPAFVRGYLRSYARLVNLAPDPVVAAYSSRGFEPPALVADISSGSQGQSESSDLPWRLMTYLIAGVVVTLVVMWWRSNMSDPFSVIDDVVGIGEPAPSEEAPSADTSLAYQLPATSTPASEGGAASATDGAAAIEAGTVAETPAAAPTPTFQSVVVPTATPSTEQPAATAGLAAPLDNPAPGVVEPAPVPQSATTAATADPSSPSVLAAATSESASAAPAPTASSPEPGSAAATSTATPGELRLAFTHDSWLEVYDAGGERLFFGMARAGREMNLRGAPPLRVLLGYARDIRVEYNGGLLDYAAFVNRGIARFIVTADGIRGEPGEAATAQQ